MPAIMEMKNDEYKNLAGRQVDDSPLFETILEPNRSLSQRGFLVLMLAVVTMSFIAGMAFIMIGAGAVIAFIGLDAVLIYAAFKVNFDSARIYESVKLCEDILVVERMRPNGKLLRWSFQPYWLKVTMEEGNSRLVLSSHGKSVILGEFLSESERVDLADTLWRELDKLRAPPRQIAS